MWTSRSPVPKTHTAPTQGRTRYRSHTTMPKSGSPPSFPNVLVGLGVILALLYWAKAVVIPVALAILLSFLLTPLVNALRRRGLGRTPAALLVVVVAAGFVGA